MFMLKDIYPNYNTILLKIDRTNHKISRKYHILQGVYYRGLVAPQTVLFLSPSPLIARVFFVKTVTVIFLVQ